MSWRERAACLRADPDAFYPERGEAGHEAKRVCASCPVRLNCLAYALRHESRFGIWGGLNERERTAIKRHNPGITLTVADLARITPPPPVCANGHVVSGENARRNGRTPDGRQRLDCVTCGRERFRRRYHERKGETHEAQ